MKNIILIAIVVSLIGCAADSSLFSKSPCKEGYEYYFLNRAAANTDLYGAEILLKGGANVDGKGYGNYIKCGGGMEYSSPLMVAVHVVAHEAAKGDPQRIDREAVLKAGTDLVELLLKAGANPNIREGEGVTPLDIAKYYKNMSIIRLLEQYGAK
jgi:hypothetical protein